MKKSLVIFTALLIAPFAQAQVSVSSVPRVDTLSSDCQRIQIKRETLSNVITIDGQAGGLQAITFQKIALQPYTLNCRNIKLEILEQKIILTKANIKEEFTINYLDPFTFNFVFSLAP